MAALCAYCGEELRPNSMFCLNCGQLASATAPAPPAVAPVAPAGVAAVDAAPPPPILSGTTGPSMTGQPRAFDVLVSTGERFRVDDIAVLGRKPQSVAEQIGAVPLSVSDASKAVSRAHLRLRVEDGVLWITDLDTANGTVLERSGRTVPCAPREEFAAYAGNRILLGGTVSCDIRAA
jgi:hypothetical protein